MKRTASLLDMVLKKSRTEINDCEKDLSSELYSDCDSYKSGMSLYCEEFSNLSERSQHAQVECYEMDCQDNWWILKTVAEEEKNLKNQVLVLEIILQIINDACFCSDWGLLK